MKEGPGLGPGPADADRGAQALSFTRTSSMTSTSPHLRVERRFGSLRCRRRLRSLPNETQRRILTRVLPSSSVRVYSSKTAIPPQ